MSHHVGAQWNCHRAPQGTKIFQYCTCPAGQVAYNFHSSSKHMHESFKSVCNKEHKGVICNRTLSNSSQRTSALRKISRPFQISLVITSGWVEFLSPASTRCVLENLKMCFDAAKIFQNIPVFQKDRKVFKVPIGAMNHYFIW